MQRRKILQDVPDYVIKHAPLVHLYSGEEFWPSDIKDHVEHMTVYDGDEPLNDTDHGPWDLHNLHHLNKHGIWNVILRSNDDVESRPSWLHSHANIPKPFEGGDNDRIPPVTSDESRGQPPRRRRALNLVRGR